jgi:hypothetical protein
MKPVPKWNNALIRFKSKTGGFCQQHKTTSSAMRNFLILETNGASSLDNRQSCTRKQTTERWQPQPLIGQTKTSFVRRLPAAAVRRVEQLKSGTNVMNA